jgi:hypothetical protein
MSYESIFIDLGIAGAIVYGAYISAHYLFGKRKNEPQSTQSAQSAPTSELPKKIENKFQWLAENQDRICERIGRVEKEVKDLRVIVKLQPEEKSNGKTSEEN